MTLADVTNDCAGIRNAQTTKPDEQHLTNLEVKTIERSKRSSLCIAKRKCRQEEEENNKAAP
jgi:hypothetical protein